MVASRLLQQHITEQLQDLVEILKNSAVLPPTCLGDEPESTPASSRTLTRAASLRGGVGAPGSPSTPPARFFTEKKIPHECLVIGALESAFKEMVGMAGESRGQVPGGHQATPLLSDGSPIGHVSDGSVRLRWFHVVSPFWNRVSVLSRSWRQDGVPSIACCPKLKR